MATVVDYQGIGEALDSQGNIVVLSDQDALVNAINLWICSFRGERLYRPREGGIISEALLKPMSNERAMDMQRGIIDGLQYEFAPAISVSECTVDPDYEHGTYWIKIKGWCPALQTAIYDRIGVNILV